jgi:hypothetical protein
VGAAAQEDERRAAGAAVPGRAQAERGAGRASPFLVRRLRSDEGLKRDVECARALGISPKRFWGWRPSPDDDLEWDQQSRDLIRALWELEADTCQGCGHPISEAWSALADPGNFNGTHVYQAPNPIRCHACTAQEIKKDTKSDSGAGYPHPQALHFPVIRQDRTRQR